MRIVRKKQSEMVIAFKNIAETTFSTEELYLLNKGPSYAPMRQKLRKQEKTVIQVQLDIVLRKLPTTTLPHNIAKFRGAILRILSTSEINSKQLDEDRIAKNLRKKQNMAFTNSD